MNRSTQVQFTFKPTTPPPSNIYISHIDNSNSQNENKPIILNDSSNYSGKSHKLPSFSPKRVSTSNSFSKKFVIYVSCPTINKTISIKSVPHIYLEFVEVFSENGANDLPSHRPYDCRIDLKPVSSLPYGPIYSLFVEESQALKEYIKENLKKNFICKSISPAGAPIFFVRKKDGTL